MIKLIHFICSPQYLYLEIDNPKSASKHLHVSCTDFLWCGPNQLHPPVQAHIAMKHAVVSMDKMDTISALKQFRPRCLKRLLSKR